MNFKQNDGLVWEDHWRGYQGVWEDVRKVGDDFGLVGTRNKKVNLKKENMLPFLFIKFSIFKKRLSWSSNWTL